MLFNSFVFAVFLPLVFVLYWTIFNKKMWMRNLFLLVASYIFYGWWDWRFLLLIALTSFCSYESGLLMQRADSQLKPALSNLLKNPKFFLTANIILNLGILAVFKYYHFFIDSFVSAFAALGIIIHYDTIQIILPVGISFYTFQALSYSIDVYRKQIEPTRDLIAFFAFVGFFPQLVAGPIERAKNLLPQFERLYRPDYERFRSAMLLIAWGFFKKLMIADRLAVFVDASFGDMAKASGFPMLLGVVFFAFQLYLDFSAYSDIAIGSARLFGFDLMTNFKRPYLSDSFDNFWKRWHISLSSWFRDYVYIPLGGNRKGNRRMQLNVLIVFAVSGLWHGASWNFVIWGTMNALFMILLDPLFFKNKDSKGLPRILKSVFIFCCWAFSLSFFRAKGFDAAIDCIQNLGFANTADIIHFGLNAAELKLSFLLLVILLIKEILWEMKGEKISAGFFRIPAVFRWVFYMILVLSMVYFGQYGGANENAFIYFQF